MVYPTPSKIYIDDTHFLVEIMGIKFSGNVKIVEWELHGQPVTDYDHYIPFWVMTILSRLTMKVT